MKFTKKLRNTHVGPAFGKVKVKHYVEDTPELFKWQAGDFLERIADKYKANAEKLCNRKGYDGLEESILKLHKTIWNNGLEGVTENMPEDERSEIYWKKLCVNYYWSCITYFNKQKRLHEEGRDIHVSDFKTETDKKKELTDIDMSADTKRDIAYCAAAYKWVQLQSMNLTEMINGYMRYATIKTKRKMADRLERMFYEYYFNGLTLQETGKIVGMGYETVRKHLIRIIDALKQNLDQLDRLYERTYEELFGYV